MAKFSLATVAWTVGAQLSLPALPPTIDLKFTVRDFKEDHPDFQRSGTAGFKMGHDTGVTTSLDADRKPVYAKSGKGTIDSADSFKQWYTDVEGTNQVFTETLTLKRKGDSNIYKFCSTKFFPVDGKGWPQSATEKRHNHNFWFTSEWHGSFVYTGSGERFSFSGDDDCWVFIDGVLAIDLGGVHGRMDKRIALADVKGTDGESLKTGESYKIDIFHAERHTSGSNFCLETSINIDKPAEECDVDEGKSCGVMSAGYNIKLLVAASSAWKKFSASWDWGMDSYTSDFKAMFETDFEAKLATDYKKTTKKARTLSGSFEISFELAFELSVISKDTTVLGSIRALLCALLSAFGVKCEWISVQATAATDKFATRRLGRSLADDKAIDMGYDIAMPSDAAGVSPDGAKAVLEDASPDRLTLLLAAAAPKALIDKYGTPTVKGSSSPEVSEESDTEILVEKGTDDSTGTDDTATEMGGASGVRAPIATAILSLGAAVLL